ncbi:unnamed protein product [Adineta steineri]|uniref:Ankyrin repeat-containing protein n=1 Tax=Adineta steineri TaxID=433720 RepID=A0A819D4F0_9BILA|nr:unnamed protein product [Adineta steineri]CAF3830995.1 unnamed protein product [Adineta steineri]
MDNRDFWPYMRVAKLPEFNPLFISSSSSPSRPPSLLSRCIDQIRIFYRYCYVHLYDIIFSTLFGYLTLNEKLYVAIHENDLFEARKLLSHGASPSYIPIDYTTIFSHIIKNKHELKNYYVEKSLFDSILANDSMLYMAVSNNNFNLVKELIDYHDYGHNGQHTEVVSLCLAVKRCYTNIVEYLIDYGHINPNDCVEPGCKHCKTHSDDIHRYQYPLYHACRQNHIKIVKYLVELKQCDINQLTTTYETCLHGAIFGAVDNRFDSSFSNQQRFEIVKYLLARSNCNPDLGLNPLCISLAHDYIYDYTSLLLSYKCNVNRLGWNLYETKSTSEKQNNQILYSLDHPLNICLRRLCKANDNTTIADHSCHKQHALKLINDGANIYAMYNYGSTYPFLLAIQTGDKIIIEAILQNAKSYIRLDIIEPLIIACTKSYHEIVQLLVDFGFNPNTIMINQVNTKLKNPVLNEISSLDFLTYLDIYCTSSSESSIPMSSSLSPIENNRSHTYINYEQYVTPFLALSRTSPWLFHPDKYDSTMKTIENLISHISIDFTIRPNRFAFYYALLNEHMPIVYYCLANFCPIDLLNSTIDFTHSLLQTHFSYTLFHLISVCCRLTSSNRIKRILFDSYAKAILRIHTYDRISSMASVVAYMRLWLTDEDFVCDQTLFEHLMSLPYVDDLVEVYDEKTLRTLFGIYYQRFIEHKPRSRPMCTLKQICRTKIRSFSQINCEHQQVNMLKILSQLDCLPKTLQAYLCYTRIKSKLLINSLLNNEPWNTIQWM